MIDQDKMRALAARLRDESSPTNGGRNVAREVIKEAADAIDLLLAEVEGLRAARIAYANEFTPDDEGLPNVGSIHENIRKLKAELEAAAADKREEPSLTNPLTPYGLLVRALRIVAGITLMDMATALLTTPAKLSAMEFGRTPVTPEFAFDVSAYFDALGVPNTASALRAAIEAPPLFKRQEES
ncbi:helix-turn-helix domain-containing protein (plasmid) [Burkholderia cenocepacia]|uniref:helix-turn-helix domain-containing protein n=1 Tax=Burkholderia cenocepacia TaxID=95486 RepID=UPI001F24724F|nr:helix-turn-helix transcriptional regulator [Burkholderia cenocepacia]UJH75009.1 helix-turn-helix domain-containing protein [Burkholderia cenocepacia]